MNFKLTIGVFLFSLLAGCSISQTVSPVGADLVVGEVCVIDNVRVRPGFMQAMQSSMQQRGIQSKVMPPNSPITVCPLTMTYTASWNWDMALYLRVADIRVYRNGVLVGSAAYDSTRGGGRLDKFVDAEKKVNELIGQLFPVR